MTKQVRFVGGPFCGHRQQTAHAPETIALPVSAGIFDYLAGQGGPLGETTSIAVYLLEGDVYHFAGAEPPCGRIFQQ